MIADRADLIAAIDAAPNDPAPRAIYADWLEERGETRVTALAGECPRAAVESWRTVWRDGFAPVLAVAGLHALFDALETDSPTLAQGCTTTPPPLNCVVYWPVEAADAIGYCGWKGAGLETVGEVEEYFARCCFEADARLEEAAACRWFLNWFDDTPRDEMRRELAPEVARAILQREGNG